jgi:hypothetical protein
MKYTSNNSRAVLRSAVAVAGGPIAQGTSARSPQKFDSGRQKAAYEIRHKTALFQSAQPEAGHPVNGDEAALPAYIGNFGKGLPHSQNGEVVAAAYQSLLDALSIGTVCALEGVDRGSGSKLMNPMAAFGFQMEGADSPRLGMPPPPAFSSAATAGEMVELYWRALARDVPFAAYDSSSVKQAAVKDLNALSAFDGPVIGSKIKIFIETQSSILYAWSSGTNLIGGVKLMMIAWSSCLHCQLNSSPRQSASESSRAF